MQDINIINIFTMPETFLLIATSVVLLISVFVNKSESIAYYLSLIILIITAALAYFIPYQPGAFIQDQYDYAGVAVFSGMYINDALAITVKTFICITVVAVFIYARPYLLQRENAKPEFYILGLFAVLGMLIMASAHNFILIYLGLELLSLCLYTLVAYMRDSNRASEAAIKYFVLGAIASGMLLYGMSILYGLSGSLDLSEVSTYLENIDEVNIALVFGLTFIVVGVAFKFGAIPFHMWMPDVYQGAPTPVTLFIATAPKFAAFVMAIRLLNNGLLELHIDWQGMLMILAVLSLFFGNIIAIAQSSIKRMLAYSTMSHVGFIFLGILSGEELGYAAALFYTSVYVLSAAGAFGVLCLLNKEYNDVDALQDLKGLSKSHPWLALIMLLLMFSMAGVPLTVGFYAKLYILQNLIYNGFIWLAILAILMSIVGAFYYLRVVKFMYFDDLDEPLSGQTSILAQTVLSINGLLIVALFIFPNSLLNYCIQAIS